MEYQLRVPALVRSVHVAPEKVGIGVGISVGIPVGITVGRPVGIMVGRVVGKEVGLTVGSPVGIIGVGRVVGAVEGVPVGIGVGAADGGVGPELALSLPESDWIKNSLPWDVALETLEVRSRPPFFDILKRFLTKSGTSTSSS